MVASILMLASCASLGRAAIVSAPVANVTVTGYPVSAKLVLTAGVGSQSDQIPALAPAPDGSDTEWVVVSGNRQDLIQVTPSGTQSMLAKAAFRTDNGPPVAYASVNADGYEWIVDNDQSVPEDSLYAVGGANSATPGVTTVATFDGYARDIALGPDGALYISDDAGSLIRCRITAQPTAVCASLPLSANVDGGAYALGAGGQLTWFTDAAGELEAITGQGTISGPFADPRANAGALSSVPGTIVEAANGLVYAAGGAESNPGGNDQIIAFDPSSPINAGILTSAVSNVVAMTLGPDGNVWFLDAGADRGAGAVGRLAIATGAVTEYPLPAGIALPASGARISAGPSLPDQNGDGEVFFSATSVLSSGAGTGNGTGVAVIGEVTGIPFPIVAGSLQFKALITVSKRRAAVLTLNCDGPSNARCSGQLGLKLPLVLPRPLSSVAYNLRGGQVLRSRVQLPGAAFRALERVSGHRLTAKVTARSKVGTVHGGALTMVGPTPRPAGG